jgi:hypothetical protein
LRGRPGWLTDAASTRIASSREDRLEAAERALPVGPVADWIKVKNPDSPAMIRAREAER